MTDPQPHTDIKLLLIFVPVAYATYLFHEFGHWTVGELLGNRMAYSLNYVWPKDGHYLRESHALYTSIAGPAFTILQAMLALLVIEKYKALYAYPFAFFPMFNRTFSLLLGGFSRQDEARISLLLGTGTYLVAFIVLAILFSMVIRCSHTLGIGPRTNGILVVVSTVCQLLVIGTYEFITL